jgi:hypothetical protein
MLVNLHVEMPADLADGASILWTDNRVPIGTNGLHLQRILRDPGEHDIVALIVTSDDHKIISSKKIRVLSPTSQPAGD